MVDNNRQWQQGPFSGFPFNGPMPPQQQMPTHPPFFQQMAQQPFQQQPVKRPGFLGQLQKPDGSWDFDKMVNHGGQIMSIVNQAKPLVKQMGPLMSLFKR